MGLDSAYGIGSLKQGVCTSSTRPASPFEGQMIYETDTDRVLVYNGTAWVLTSSAGSYSPTSATVYPNFLVYFSGANGSVVNNAYLAYNTTLYDDTSSVTSGVFTVPAGQAGIYQFNVAGNCYNIGTSGYFRIQLVTSGSTGLDINGSQTPAQGGSDVFSISSATVKLAVSDTVKVRWIVPATGLYSAGITYNSFSGTRIR
jgi:hypothetical protein